MPRPSSPPPSRASRGCSSTSWSMRRSRATWAACCTPLRCRPATPEQLNARLRRGVKDSCRRPGRHRADRHLEPSARARRRFRLRAPACAASIRRPMRCVAGEEARIRQAFANMKAIAESRRRQPRRLRAIDGLCHRYVPLAAPLVNKVQEELWAGGPYPPRTIMEVDRAQSGRYFRGRGHVLRPEKA